MCPITVRRANNSPHPFNPFNPFNPSHETRFFRKRPIPSCFFSNAGFYFERVLLYTNSQNCIILWVKTERRGFVFLLRAVEPCARFKTFTNTTQVLVLKPGGQAISEEAFKKVVEKEGKYEGKRVKGVIRLQKGGCGFAASGTQVESNSYFSLGAGSGLADGRGQQRGAKSRFGLVFN